MRSNQRLALLPDWLEGSLACPACRGGLQRQPTEWRCSPCGRGFPVRFGIPDFRLRADPFISIPDEERKVERILSAGPADFNQLLERYYRMSPENPPALNRHYRAAMQRGLERGTACLEKLRKRFEEAPLSPLLDLGCGTAGLTAAAARRGLRAAGVDVALRWLVIGRQRLQEAGVSAPLLCANAEALPFRDEAFQAALADSVLEHVRDSQSMRDEMLRVLRPSAVFFLVTNNRYSLLPEPHLHLWGFGWLPRRCMARAAWLLRRTPYKARLHSLFELNRLFQDCAAVELPDYHPDEMHPSHRRLGRLWERVRRSPLASPLRPFVPQYFIFGCK